MSVLHPSALSVEDKIGQLFFIGIPGHVIDEQARMLLDDVRPGGVCLFARNIKEPHQTRGLLDGVRSHLQVEPLLSLDQEGGRVDRLRRLLSPMPAADRIRTIGEARELGEIVGQAISLLGFNMDFAPVVDVIDTDRKELVNGLQSRGFGKTKEEVVELSTAFLEGLETFGMLGCLKHFPGLGAAQVDSHEQLPDVRISEEVFRTVDMHPYRELIQRDGISVMVAHATYPDTHLQEADQDGKLLPSSLNRRIVTSLLRDELNFKGVAITDDMEMGAVVKNYGIGEASVSAINAGEDMIAICARSEAIYEAHRSVSEAIRSGRIAPERFNEAISRIADLKSRIAGAPKFDPDGFAAVSDRVRKLTQHLN